MLLNSLRVSWYDAIEGKYDSIEDSKTYHAIEKSLRKFVCTNESELTLKHKVHAIEISTTSSQVAFDLFCSMLDVDNTFRNICIKDNSIYFVYVGLSVRHLLKSISKVCMSAVTSSSKDFYYLDYLGSGIFKFDCWSNQISLNSYAIPDEMSQFM